ncbi:MAG: ABC transporter substrate-binding protein [Deltaproteobacteria bacterium]|nr:MAG: ABC transporter substrate-binding protein [Deltaproteobacteria bacterium]
MKWIFLQIGAFLGFCSVAMPVHAQTIDRAVLAFGSTGPNLTPFWVARDAGLYRQYGLDVDVVFFRGSTIAINALATRDAHFGAFGASSSVLAKLGGVDTVLIATATPGLLFYLVTRKEIRNASDLKGKKIAASRPGTDSDLAARVAVQKLGLSEKDVNILSMGTDTERMSAMSQGVVEATVVTIGGYVAAQKLGFHSLIDLSQANVPYEAASLITTRALIKENPDMVLRFTKGFVAAIQYAQTHREATLKILTKYMRTSDADILNASYDYYVGRVIPRTPYVSEKGLQAVIDFIRQRNPQIVNVKAQDFMDNRFIKELDESGFIKSLYAK